MLRWSKKCDLKLFWDTSHWSGKIIFRATYMIGASNSGRASEDHVTLELIFSSAV